VRNKLLTFALVALISLAAGVFVALFLLQEQRNRAQIEVETAHSELELALATLAVRMSSMATAIERAASTSPMEFEQVYTDTIRAMPRARERAMALMLEFATSDQADRFVAG
jgi:hypothetical protein